MNFYFAIKSHQYRCKLSIPKFSNSGKIDKSVKLFEAKISKNLWIIKEAKEYDNGNFFILNDKDLDNHKIYFLAKLNEVYGNDSKLNFIKTNELLNYSNYTATYPDYRSNLRIFDNFAFSSYQSDYPFKMLNSKSSTLSSIYPLTDYNADNNKIFFRNIYYLPIIEEFFAYIIDITNRKVIRKIKLLSNTTNEINLEKSEIKKNSYFFAKDFTGIPIFISQKKNSISMEHTHPPHHYLYDNNKFEIIKNLKKKIDEILYKENI